jgi:hypothetical protein
MLPVHGRQGPRGGNDALRTIAAEPANGAGSSRGMSAYAPGGSAIVPAAPRRRAPAFLGLFFVPSLGQSILLTVVPLEALRLLGTARTVTLL